MKTLYKSKSIEVSVDENQILLFIWKDGSKTMTDKEYKTDTLMYAKFLYELRPLKTLTDIREMNYVVTPELQEWGKKEAFKEGIITQKSAFLVSPDFFVQMSVEQLLDEVDMKTRKKEIAIRYFQTELEAYNWLQDDKN